MTVWPPPPRRPTPLKTAGVIREPYGYFSLTFAGLVVLIFFVCLLGLYFTLPSWTDVLVMDALLFSPILSVSGLVLGIRGRNWWTGKLGILLSSLELLGMATAITYFLANFHYC